MNAGKIMRRVYLIWGLRCLRYSLVVRALAVAGAFWWLNYYVSIRPVTENTLNFSDFSHRLSYLSSAFSQTELVVQIVLPLTLLFVLWFLAGSGWRLYARRRLNFL